MLWSCGARSGLHGLGAFIVAGRGENKSAPSLPQYYSDQLRQSLGVNRGAWPMAQYGLALKPSVPCVGR